MRAVLVTAVLIATLSTSLDPPRPVTATPMVLLGILPLFALVLDGPVAVWLVAASSCAALAWAAATVKFAGSLAPIVLSNIALAVVFSTLVVLVESQAHRRLRERGDSLAAERDQAVLGIEARQTARRMGGALELGVPARGAEVLLRFPAARA